MYKICKYCLSKARLGVIKVSLCIYHLFGFFGGYLAFFGAIWLFLRVDLTFFAYDYLATLVCRMVVPDDFVMSLSAFAVDAIVTKIGM